MACDVLGDIGKRLEAQMDREAAPHHLLLSREIKLQSRFAPRSSLLLSGGQSAGQYGE